MKPILLFLFVLIASAALLYSEPESAAMPPVDEPVEDPVSHLSRLEPSLRIFISDFEGYFADAMLATGTPGAAVVVVKDGQVIYAKGYGEKASGIKDPVDEHTLFRIGSLSKGFAGILTGILVEKGYLNWEDPVIKHYPGFRLKEEEQAKRLQVRHILSHTTGLPYHAYDNLIEAGLDRETITAEFLPNANLYGKEGEFFAYQNVAYSIIEPVLQAATGQTYASLLKNLIFDPAGMSCASLDYETMKNAPEKALPHSSEAGGWWPETISPLYYDFAAAGGVNATISDMGEWLKVLLGQRPDIVSDSTLDDVFRPVVATGLERRTLPGWIERDSAFYGMGWRVLFNEGDTLVYHAGMVNDFHSEIAFSREDGVGICVLFNAGSAMRRDCIQRFFEIWYAQRTD